MFRKGPRFAKQNQRLPNEGAFVVWFYLKDKGSRLIRLQIYLSSVYKNLSHTFLSEPHCITNIFI